MKKIISNSQEETRGLGRKIASVLKDGDILGLIGELGAGKTCLIKGLADGLNVQSSCYVSSPTYTILKVYPGDMKLNHFDFYRLSDPEEFEDLGFEDYLKDGGITAIEWADKFSGLLPKDMMEIRFEVLGDNERKITIPDNLWTEGLI